MALLLDKHGNIFNIPLLGEDFVHDLEYGPSADIWCHGHELLQERGDSWYEDALSSFELNLLCGVYKVYTG